MVERNATYEQLLRKLEPAGQQGLLRFWDELTASEQAQLAKQIKQLDLKLFAQLRQQFGGTEPGKVADHRAHWAALAARATSPRALRLDGSGVDFSNDEAVQRGEQLLRGNKVGMILVAGGLGTRLGCDEPKGMFPIGPLSQRTLFQVLIESLLAVRKKYQSAIPLYVMTSAATDLKTRTFLAAHSFFGLPPEDVKFFSQSSMFAVDDNWQQILMSSKSELVLAPDGHGGMLAAFEKSDSLADCRKRGIDLLFYGQIDNPLLQVCDPLLLGSHVLAKSEMTTQVVKKRRPAEKVGVLVSADDKVQMIEYSDLPEANAHETLPDGSLKFWAGSLAVHVFDRALLERAAKQADSLPFHIAHKKTPHVNERGERIEPEKPNAFRFERFIFDLLHVAERALVVEADPALAFAPVKNSDAEENDNPRLAKLAMQALARRQLREAGVRIADDVPVEINPLAAKLLSGSTVTQPTYFAPDGPRVITDSLG